MAEVQPPPSSYQTVDCKGVFVTFDCTGDFTTSRDSQAKLGSAQLALITGSSLLIRVNDAKKHNGFCYAERVDVYAP